MGRGLWWFYLKLAIVVLYITKPLQATVGGDVKDVNLGFTLHWTLQPTCDGGCSVCQRCSWI